MDLLESRKSYSPVFYRGKRLLARKKNQVANECFKMIKYFLMGTWVTTDHTNFRTELQIEEFMLEELFPILLLDIRDFF